MKSFFRLLLLVVSVVVGTSLLAQQNYAVRLAHGTEVFPLNFQEQKKATVPEGDFAKGHFVRYVQFDRVLRTGERQALEAMGARIVGYVQFATYELILPKNFDFALLAPLSPRSVMKAPATWKLHHTLRERPLGDWAVHGSEVDVVARVYSHLSIGEGADLCRQAGLVVRAEGTQNGILQLRIAQDQIETVAALPFVQWLEQEPPPSQKEDLNGRSLHRANLLDSEHPLGKKYNGEGVRTLVRDDGAVGPHIDFQGRLFNQPDANPPLTGTHGDGVAGIIGGAGNLDPTKKGMAAGADLYVVDYVNSFQDATLPLHLNEGVTITNSSYSDGCNVGYTTATQTVDNQLAQNPTLMHVFSAGNSNGSDCGYGAGSQWGNITGGHKMAKNAIATANLRVNGAIEGSSSRGPAHDGRMKPDIAAHGAEQNSTDPNNTYQVFGGTSAAAPGIAGCLAQLTHAYRSIHGVAEAPSALLKLSVLATANDLGNVGPDFIFGWGHVNNWRALRLLEEQRHTEGVVEQSTTTTHTVDIPLGTQDARLMIYWVDPAAALSTSRALVNDLDVVVTAPDGTIFRPWLLDPTPNVTALNTPATRGRDSLNNAEQVSISNPTPGTYTVYVTGFEVPDGPQAYYLAWDFLTPDIKMVYPTGGESFVPGTKEWIRWDASAGSQAFALQYSVNDGSTWVNIATPTSSARSYEWTVPAALTGKARVRVTRGIFSDDSEFPFSIAPLPANLTVERVCPDSMFLSWVDVQDTLSYDMYLLGQKYMEIQGTSSQPIGGFPIVNAAADAWVAVRVSHPDGLAGRRTNAIYWPGGLKECAQPDDANLADLLEPSGGIIIGCGATTQDVVIRVTNDGLNPIVGGTVSYQIDNLAAVTEPIGVLPVGASLTHTFATQINLIGLPNNVNLRTWVSIAGEDFLYNDTLQTPLVAVTQVANNFFQQGFNSANLPSGWVVENPDNTITWTLTNGITGASGQNTRALWVNHFDYQDQGQEDYLYCIPFDLSNQTDPALIFNYSHANFSSSFLDGLRVEAYADCDLGSTPIVIWEKIDPELATAQSSTAFEPDAASDWSTEVVSLEQFAGESVVIRFVSINGYGNNTYLDNIGLTQFNPIAPIANFVLANDSICRNDTVVFLAQANQGLGNLYTWTFGAGAFPATATGPGPHEVFFPSVGNRNIRLIVNNAFGTDTLIQQLRIVGLPTANFTATPAVDAPEVQFTNFSTNGVSYLWDFGDGTTSTEINPTHTYATPPLTYTVTLTTTNFCRIVEKSLPVTLTVNTFEQIGLAGALVLPNPTAGDFWLELNNNQTGIDAQIQLLDVQGRLVHNLGQVNIATGRSTVRFDGLNLPTGQYTVRISTAAGVASLPVIVQR
jgi:PKD repeat protein